VCPPLPTRANLTQAFSSCRRHPLRRPRIRSSSAMARCGSYTSREPGVGSARTLSK
jgi:hypothetical protein